MLEIKTVTNGPSTVQLQQPCHDALLWLSHSAGCIAHTLAARHVSTEPANSSLSLSLSLARTRLYEGQIPQW